MAPPARESALGPARAAVLADLLRALGHPLRLRLVTLLCQGELHVAALAERLATAPVLVSQQLRILRMSHLVEVRRRGSLAYYRLGDTHLRQLVRCLGQCTLADRMIALRTNRGTAR